MWTQSNQVEQVDFHSLSLSVCKGRILSRKGKYLLVVSRNSGGVISGVGSILHVETGLA